MANIVDINEPWRDHDGLEVETFIKRQFANVFGFKFGAVARIGTDLVFYDEDNGNVLATVSLSGQTYTINIASNMPQTFYVLADETSKVMEISPTTSVSSFGQSEAEDYPESYSFVVAVNTGGGYVNRVSGEIPIHGTASFDIRPYLATGDNYIRVTVTGQQSNQTRTMVFTSMLTTLTLSVNHAWQTVWNGGHDYTITGIRFAGSLVKTLHVSVNDVECTPVTYQANQSYTTTATFYTIPAAAFPSESNSVCSVKLWMTAQGVSTPVFSFNIMCVAAGDSTPLVAINSIVPTAYNYSSGALFSYAVYNANKVSIDMSATLNSVVYNIASGIVVTDREAGNQYPFAFSIEIDTGANETKIGSLAISATAYLNDTVGGVSTASTLFDNTYSYLATPGALFYLNAATRDNGSANHESIINEMGASQDGNFPAVYNAVWSGLSWYNDGWAADSGSRRALVVPAGCSCSITGLAPLALLPSYPNGMSIELLMQNGSPSDYETPVLTISSLVGNNPCGLIIYPTKIVVFGQAERDEDFQSINISENRITHIVVTFVKAYEMESGKNLCSVYINGISNVNFAFDGSSSFGVGNLVIGQPDTDVYLYKMRVYGMALEAQAVFANFLNCVFDGVEFTRTDLVAKNNVLEGDVVDYAKVVAAGYNTMVVTTPNNEKIPSFFNNVTVKNSTVSFRYADDSQKNVTVSGVDMDGQGTTSKKYYRWNLRWKTSSNTVWSYGDGTTETGKEGHFIKDSTHTRVDRITAKKNIASSPQGHKMGLTGLYNDLFHAIGPVVAGLPDPNINVAVYQFPFVGFQYNTQNGQYDFIGVYTAGPDKGSKVTFGYSKSQYPNCLSIEGPNHAPRGTRFLCPWVDVEYDPNEETLTYGGEEGWDCDYVKYETSTKGTQADWDAIRALYETEWRPAYDNVYDNSPYLASSQEVINALNEPTITTIADLISAANAATIKDGVTNGMMVRNEFIAFYASEANTQLGIAKYDLFFYRRTAGRFEKLPNDYPNNNALTGLTQYLSDLGYSTTAPTTEQLIKARGARFKATMGNYWDLNQTLFHYCYCVLYGVTDNFAKNSYPQKFLRLTDSGAGNRWGWRQDDLDSVLMTDNNGSNTKKYSVEHLDTFDGVQIFQGGDSALWVLIKQNYEAETKDMMNRIAQAATSLATSLGIQGSGMHESLFNLTAYYCWDHSAKYFPATIYEKERRWSYLEPWLLAGQTIPGTSELYPSQYNGVAPLRQALGDQYQGERLWMERRIAYMFSKYRIGAFTGTNTGYNAIVFTLAQSFTFTLTPAIDLYPVVSLVNDDQQAGRTPAGSQAVLSIGASGDSNNSIHGGDWLASLGDLHLMRLGSRGGTSSIDFFVTAARLRNLKIGDATPWDTATIGFNATAFGITSPTVTSIDARNTDTIRNNINLLGCPRLRTCLFGGSGASGLMLPVGAKLTLVSFPDAATTVFMHSLPFLQASGLTLPALAGITTLYINNCTHLNPMAIVAAIIATAGEQLAYATLIWSGVVSGDAETLVELSKRAGRVTFDGQSLQTILGLPDVEGTVDISENEVTSTQLDALELDLEHEEDYSENLKKALCNLFDSALYVLYNPDAVIEPFLYFQAAIAGSTVGMTNYNNNAPVLYWSTNKEDWRLWDYSTLTIENVGDKIYFYGVNDRVNTTSNDSGGYSTFIGTGLSILGGSFNTLQRMDGSRRQTGGGCFYKLFYANESIDLADDLTMHYATLEGNSFNSCFGGCINITKAPVRLFKYTTRINENSLYRFFYGCTALVSAPEMPMTYYQGSCCCAMFENCTALVHAPSHITILDGNIEGPLKYMFKGCSSLRKAPEVDVRKQNNSQWYGEDYYQMFMNCTSLVEVPKFNVTTTTAIEGNTSYGNELCSVFENCTSLVDMSHITLPKQSGLSSWTFRSMFKGCTSLRKAPKLVIEGAIANNDFYSMFEGCTNLDDISGITFGTYHYSHGSNHFTQMFQGCSSLVDASNVKIIPLSGTGVFQSMFKNCTSLEMLPNFVNDSAAGNSEFKQMFNGCTALTTLPTMTLQTNASESYEQMFYGCTSLVDASALTISGTIANEGCNEMFRGCSAMTKAPAISATGVAGNRCCQNMFRDCTSLTDVSLVVLPSPSVNQCYQEMFRGCSAMTYAPTMIATNAGTSACVNMFTGADNIVDASRISISGNSSQYSYQQLFYQHTKLVTPPHINIVNGTIGQQSFDAMFSGCTGLVDASGISITCTITNSGSFQNMFYGCANLVNAPTISIDYNNINNATSGMFNSCLKLVDASSVVVYNDKTLGTIRYESNMFNNCRSLTTINPGAVKVNGGAFNGCAALTEVTLGDGVVLEANAFKGCTSLQVVTLLGAVGQSNSNAFVESRIINRINISDFGKYVLSNWSNGDYAHPFEGNDGNSCNYYINGQVMTSVTLPNTLTAIKERLFLRARGLASISVPNTITEVKHQAFRGCSSLITIDLPATVTTIGDSAFIYTNNMTSFICRATTPPSLGSGVFENTPHYPFYVPAESVEAYKAANRWSHYSATHEILPIQE